MNETLSVPLNQLVAWDGNVRRTGASEAIDELAASIAAHGLLQAPVVRKIPGKKGNGKYAVIAGRRRLQALQLLVQQDRLPADWPVSCHSADNAADAGEISLAENVVRVAMHPADQFEAFRDLVERGTAVPAIAARFGVSETVVAKRLKLGRLSPAVLAAYRAGEIGLEQAQAFAIVDDHAAQEGVLASLSAWSRTPGQIRDRLTEDEVAATNKRVRFVGLEAYEQAGGAVRRDLFDDEDSGTIIDTALLDRLVSEKLTAIAEEVRAEGWSWVDIAADRAVMSEFCRVQPTRREATQEEEAQLLALRAEHDALVDGDEADDADGVIADRIEAIEAAMDIIESSLTSWSPDTLARAGAFITVDWSGEADIERGLMRRDEAAIDDEDAGAQPKPVRPALPAALVADLTAQKTGALQAMLSRNVDVALAAVVHALALPVFANRVSHGSCLQLSLRKSFPERHITDTVAAEALHKGDDVEARWLREVPTDGGALWPWCLAQSRDTLLELLAFIAARSLDAVQAKCDRPDDAHLVHANALAGVLNLDMAAWFTPTAANYFSRINSAQIIEALSEAKGVPPAPAWTKMKKAELAAFAAREIAGTGWLPQPLRVRESVSTEEPKAA